MPEKPQRFPLFVPSAMISASTIDDRRRHAVDWGSDMAMWALDNGLNVLQKGPQVGDATPLSRS
ncbi:MAG: hypothetical protein V4764_00940 [Burkholderia sp.]